MNHLQIWDTFGSLCWADLPANVQQVANQCVLDWTGCALAGSREPLAEILRAQFGHRSGTASVFGSDLKLEVATAALLNGASGHALDFDDTNAAIGCHATAPVIPAVLAVAEELGASGEQLLTAFVVGTEVEGRINYTLGRDHYARGWHTTATYGTFGATAAVCHLLGFDQVQYATAMGLAASHASGVKANFGTMTKPYHAGRAAEAGVNCARLVERGFTANPDAVMGNQGFAQAASTSEISAERFDQLTGRWLILETLFKNHAACHLTHAGIESVLRLRADQDVSDLASLTITVHPGVLDVCGIEHPKTGLEGKFSLRGTASLVLNGIDTTNPATYVDEVISSEPVQAMMEKIQVSTDESLENMETRVTWVDRSQASHEAYHNIRIPATDLDAQGDSLETKFAGLCSFVDLDAEAEREALRARLA